MLGICQSNFNRRKGIFFDYEVSCLILQLPVLCLSKVIVQKIIGNKCFVTLFVRIAYHWWTVTTHGFWNLKRIIQRSVPAMKMWVTHGECDFFNIYCLNWASKKVQNDEPVRSSQCYYEYRDQLFVLATVLTGISANYEREGCYAAFRNNGVPFLWAYRDPENLIYLFVVVKSII